MDGATTWGLGDPAAWRAVQGIGAGGPMPLFLLAAGVAAIGPDVLWLSLPELPLRGRSGLQAGHRPHPRPDGRDAVSRARGR